VQLVSPACEDGGPIPARDFTALGLAELADLLVDLQRGFDETAGDLDPFQLNWKAAPERWSVGECLDHLNSADRQLLPRLTAAVARGHAERLRAPGPFRYGAIGRWFVRTVSPAGTRKVKAPRLYRPAASRLDPADVRVARADLQMRLRAVLARAAGLDLAQLRVASPLSFLLRFPLGIWFASTVAHQARHLGQMRRVLSSPGFPTGALVGDTAPPPESPR